MLCRLERFGCTSYFKAPQFVLVDEPFLEAKVLQAQVGCVVKFARRQHVPMCLVMADDVIPAKYRAVIEFQSEIIM